MNCSKIPRGTVIVRLSRLWSICTRPLSSGVGPLATAAIQSPSLSMSSSRKCKNGPKKERHVPWGKRHNIPRCSGLILITSHRTAYHYESPYAGIRSIPVIAPYPERIPSRSDSGLAAAVQLLSRRVVVQVLPEPSLDLYHAHPLAFAIVGDLITVDLAEAEIS